MRMFRIPTSLIGAFDAPRQSIWLIVMVLCLAALPAGAQFRGDQQRGFSPNQVYQVGELDSVNVSNGDVIVRIPLGQEYPVGPSLRYQFILTYNSKVWEHGFGIPGTQDQDQRFAYPERNSNAGFGWILSLGQLLFHYPRLPDAEPWIYLAPDGAEYHFETPNNPSTDIPPTLLYSFSGQYLRMRRDSSAAFPYMIDFPDGETHTFDREGNLREMRDSFGNWVKVNGIGTTQWVVTDGHGTTTVRTHRLNWENLLPTRYPDQPNFVRRIVGVDLAAFDGQRAEYSFGYTDDVSIGYGGGAPQHPNPCVKGPVLSSVNLPDGSSYQPKYDTVPSERCADNVLNDDFGAIQSLTLPTGGSIAWDYGSYEMTMQSCYSPVVGWSNGFRGVVGRKFKDRSGSVISEWKYRPILVPSGITYTGKICGSDPSVVTVPGPDEEFVNIVQAPDGLVTKHYFTAWPENAPHGMQSPHGFNGDQFGLPISARRVDDEGRFLSTEVFDCSGGCALDGFGALVLPEWPVQRTYLSYSRETLLHNGLPWVGIRKYPWVVTGQRIELEIDGNGDGTKFVDTDYLQSNGYGYFRDTRTSSNFAGTQTRTSTVVRQQNIDADTWLLDQPNETRVKDGAGPELKLSEACWDSNGFLTRKHVFRGLADQNDFLSVFEPDARGNVGTERHHSVPAVFETCGAGDPGTALVTMNHQWSSGSLSSTQYAGVQHKSTDLDIDPSTGLAIRSRDGNGRTTAYEYDVLGRLKAVKPPSEAESRYDYFVLENPSHVVAKQILPSAETSETESHFYYDGLGRLIQQKRRMPLGWATVSHTYDSSGRKASETVPTFEATAPYSAAPSQAPGTTYSYDILGRTTKVVAPDQSKVETSYTGRREVSRDAKVATIPGDTANQTPFRTTEVYDGFGRLVEVQEPLPNGSSLFTSTGYTYDFGDRLTSVVNGQSPRTFQYDRSGLLISDTHPERGAGTYTYDGRGRLLTKQLGTAVSLLHFYDAAERLTQVRDNIANRPLKTFTFDSDGTEVERGKLLGQTRFNYFPGNVTYVVTDRFQYHPSTGRLASKNTDVQTPTGTKSTTQQYTYDSVGQPEAIHFPTCSNCGTFPFGARSLPLTWSDGLLTGIGGAATAIDYAASGVVSRVVHATTDQAPATGVVDEYQQDVTGARPARIKFANVSECKVILRHPASDDILKFESATFSLEAVPGATIQWYQGISGTTTVPIAGAVEPTYTTPSLTATTNYWARVTAPGGGCHEDTLTVTAAVCTIPVVQTPEATSATTVYTDVPLTFSVDVVGAVTYEWFTRIGSNGTGTPIPGSGPVVTYTPLEAASSRQIVVRVISPCGTVIHVVAILDVVEAAECTADFDPVYTNVFPRNFTIMPNQVTPLTALLRMSAASEAAFPKRRYSFRWYADGDLDQSTDTVWKSGDSTDPIAGHTGPFRGNYNQIFVNQSIVRLEAWVSCYNTVGAPEATPAAVSKKLVKHSFGVMNGHCPVPDLAIESASVVLTGASATLRATVIYPDALYQWYEGESGNTFDKAFNGQSDELEVTSPGTYWLRVSSECGAHHDSPTITVSRGACAPVRILRDPVGATVAAGTLVPLSVDAAGIPSPTYYLWFTAYNGPGQGNSQPIAETNGKRSITVAPLETTDYFVRAGNGLQYINDCSLVNSRVARVHVTSCADITVQAQPADVLFRATDQSVNLSIQATAASPLQYQWFMGESGDMSHPITPGGNSPTLQLTWASHLQDPAANKFWVKVSFPTPPGLPKRCAVDSRTVNVCRLPRVHNPIGPYSNSVPLQRRVLEVGVTGDGLTYQWYQGDGNANPPDTSHPLNSQSSAVVIYPQITTKYWVKISSSCAPTEWIKQVSEVSVCPSFNDGGVLTATKTLVTSGTTTTLSVSVDRGDRIEWYKVVGTAAPVKFAEGPGLTTVTTPPVTQQTRFFARAASGICTRDSEQITIDICTSPTVHWSSGPTQVAKGATFFLTAGLNAGETANWAWYQGTTSGDVANSTLVYQSSNAYQLSLQSTASYWVRATDAQNGCYSDTSVRTVNVCIPTILGEPQSVTINAGSSTALTVTTDNVPGASYQWYRGQPGDTSNPVAGATSATVNVTPAATTTYWVRVSGCPSPLTPVTRDSQAATVTICQVPAITVQPASSWQTTPPTTLSVTATGTQLTYQWYRGLAGDTSTPLATTSSMNVSPTQTTNYWVRVSGFCGSAVNSSTAKVSVKPTITSQPVGGPITKGTTRALSVTAGGTELTYQWYQRPVSGSPTLISGATGASYTPPPVMADATYFVRAFSGAAYQDSNDALLAVCLAREIEVVNYPSGHSGSQVVLRAANAAAGETFEWYRGAVGNTSDPLGGDTVKTLYPAVTTTYWLRTKRAGCDADSAPLTINICYPAITAQPEASSLIASGTTKTLSVAVTGTAPLVYQWYQGAVGVTTTPVGTNSSSFITPALTASTSYWVRISTNAAACASKFVNSQQATVNVCQPPVITAQPQANNQLPVGLNYTLSVSATGEGLHYQWYIGESGVTTTPVGTDSNQISVTANQTKKYWVRVTGTCGVVNSVAALQSVKPIITSHPQTANVCGLGGTATFSATATGAEGYKWYRGAEIVGTDRILNIAITNASWDFRVVVTSGDASTTSQTAGVNILPVPTVTSFTATQETSTRWLLRAYVAAADEGLVKYRFYEGALGNTTTLLSDTTTSYLRVFPSSQPKTYWVAVYYTNTGCATNRAVTIP